MKIQVSLKYDKNNGYLTFAHLWHLTEFFLEWEMFHTKLVEKIKTQFVFKNFFFLNCVIYEITWENMVEPDKPKMTI